MHNLFAEWKQALCKWLAGIVIGAWVALMIIPASLLNKIPSMIWLQANSWLLIFLLLIILGWRYFRNFLHFALFAVIAYIMVKILAYAGFV